MIQCVKDNIKVVQSKSTTDGKRHNRSYWYNYVADTITIMII